MRHAPRARPVPRAGPHGPNSDEFGPFFLPPAAAPPLDHARTRTMKQALGQLKQLQELTEQVEQVRRDKEALAVDVRNQQRVCEEKRRRTDQAHQQRIQTTMRADETQVNIQQAEAEIGRLNVQLNAVRHQKEYDALQHSILSHRADIQKWEDEGLAALQATDELSRARASASRRRACASACWFVRARRVPSAAAGVMIGVSILRKPLSSR